MLTIGARLKEERVRLGKTQTDFAALASVGKTTQINYESGSRSPDAEYLAAVATAGADVLYILTGDRSFTPPPAHTKREEALLDNYRHTDAEGQRAIESVATLAAKPKANTGGK